MPTTRASILKGKNQLRRRDKMYKVTTLTMSCEGLEEGYHSAHFVYAAYPEQAEKIVRDNHSFVIVKTEGYET